jgi:hypothetical protein
VVLAELAGGVAVVLEQLRDDGVLRLQTDQAVGMPTFVRPVQ